MEVRLTESYLKKFGILLVVIASELAPERAVECIVSKDHGVFAAKADRAKDVVCFVQNRDLHYSPWVPADGGPGGPTLPTLDEYTESHRLFSNKTRRWEAWDKTEVRASRAGELDGKFDGALIHADVDDDAARAIVRDRLEEGCTVVFAGGFRAAVVNAFANRFALHRFNYERVEYRMENRSLA